MNVKDLMDILKTLPADARIMEKLQALEKEINRTPNQLKQ